MPRWATAPLYLLAACTVTPPPAQQPLAPAPDIVLRGVTLRNYRENEIHLSATMPRLELMRESTDLTAKGVRARLASGVIVNAATVTGNANAGVIHGSEGVTLSSPSGIEGHAASATYDRSLGPQGGAHGEDGMHLEHARFSLDAKAFTLNFATEHANFTDAVTRTKAPTP